MSFSLNQWFTQRVIGFLLGIFLPLSIFLGLAKQIGQQRQSFTWDLPVLYGIHATAHPLLDQVAQHLTLFGTIVGVLPIWILLGIGLVIRRQWQSLIYFVITPSGSALINYTAKLFFQRQRPHLWEMIHPHSIYAFPSGHAMFSTSFAIALLVLTWNTRWRGLVLFVGSLYVGTIGWTRLYLGVHYPSDILAGWMLAIAWSVAVLLILQSWAVLFHKIDRQFLQLFVKP